MLVAHTLKALGIELPWYLGEKLGGLGVLFFFVHTSLVLLSSLERQGTEVPHWIRAFYVRRAFRIYPLAVVTVIAAVLFRIPEHIGIPSVAPTVASARTLLANLSLSQNLTGDPNILGVLWSLPVEVQMYLFLPVCFLVAKRRVLDVALLWIAFVVAGLFVLFAHVRGVGRLSMFGFGPCFMGGVLAFYLLRRRTRATLPAQLWPVIIVVCGALIVALDPTSRHPEPGWIPCLALGAAIPFVRDAAPSFASRCAHHLCEVSYGIYLLHEPVLWFAFVVLHSASGAAQWTVFTTLMLALPWIAYRMIERPAIHFGHRVAARVATPLQRVLAS